MFLSELKLIPDNNELQEQLEMVSTSNELSKDESIP